MDTLKKIAGTVAILSLAALAPIGASATTSAFNSDSSVGISMNADGTLKVVGAKVTSISNNTVNAEAAFGNSELNFSVVTDSATKVNRSGSNQPSINALNQGDKISFSGKIISSTGSNITVDADHLVSKVFLNELAGRTVFTGKVKSVNSSNKTLVLQIKDYEVEVRTTSSTSITVDGVVQTFAFLDQGDRVKVEGSINPALTVVTATKITANDDERDDDKGDKSGKDKDKENKGKQKGWLWGLGNIFKKDK